jgi:AraC-like DNA-binding protein
MKKSNKLSDEDSKKLLDEICVWIDENIEKNIGWEAICDASQLNHKELLFLFDKYKQTSPMTYIRKRRTETSKQKPQFTVTPNFLSKNDE